MFNIDHATLVGTNTYVLPTENEWYKAAYYQGNRTYLKYAGSDEMTTEKANYGNPNGNIIAVGNYPEFSSYYGTYDQNGNVWEWNEDTVVGSNLGVRGGAFSYGIDMLVSNYQDNDKYPTVSDSDIGFRVSNLASVPEINMYAYILGIWSLGLAIYKRINRKK